MYNDVIERNKFLQDNNIPIYYQPVDYGSLPSRVVNEDQDWLLINKTYSKDKVVIIDNFLNPKYVEELRKYVLITSIREDFYSDYAALNFYRNPGKLWFKILSNIVDESKVYLSILHNLTFERAWSFIYNNQSEGVKIHADTATINLNLWVTADESIDTSIDTNGLSIWRIERPNDWCERDYNANLKKSVDFINKNGIVPINIPYKCNRAIIFNSAYFHQSLPVNVKPGYQNRRINYTFLFS